MPVKNVVAQIIDRKIIAMNTVQLRLGLPNNEKMEFVPGQFVNILVAPNIRRSYSVASTPDKTYLDLIADTYAGGPGSQFFQNAKVGDAVQTLGPLGKFMIAPAPRPLYFYATGTGLVPLMSMIEGALIDPAQGNSQREMYLISGFRYEADIFARELFEQLAQKYPNFHYILSLTRPEIGWTGKTGRVTEYINQLTDPNLDAYVCGSSQVIASVKADLVAKGVPLTQVYYEQYY